MTNKSITVLAICVVMMTGCSATTHRQEVQDQSADRLTVGTVQREVSIGMPASDVAAVMGSPNIVTTDEERREVWVWDKMSTNVSYSRSNGAIVGLIVGGSGAGGGAASKSSGAASTSQRTLTVIIKFDEANFVRDVSYRTSSF